ncbi:hypothetical protein ACVXHA_07420 [Escherichia coli]
MLNTTQRIRHLPDSVDITLRCEDAVNTKYRMLLKEDVFMPANSSWVTGIS